MAYNQISYGSIIAAQSGDSEAMTMILRHYAPYIAFCAKRSFYDDYGNRYEIVDEDIRQSCSVDRPLWTLLAGFPIHWKYRCPLWRMIDALGQSQRF